MLLEDDAFRDITVNDIDSEVKSFGPKSVLLVDFDEEVD